MRRRERAAFGSPIDPMRAQPGQPTHRSATAKRRRSKIEFASELSFSLQAQSCVVSPRNVAIGRKPARPLSALARQKPDVQFWARLADSRLTASGNPNVKAAIRYCTASRRPRPEIDIARSQSV